MENNDDEEPEYMTWKRVIARVTNRIKGSDEAKIF